MKRFAPLLLALMPSLAFAATETHEAVTTAVAGDAAHHGGEAAGGGGASLPQFDVTTFPSQIFWLAVTMIVVYTVVKRVVFPQIGDSLATRENHINGMLQEAGALNEKARVTQANYEKSIADARSSARENLTRARNDIAAQLASSEATQREQFSKARDEFIANFEAQKAKLATSIESEAKTLAADVVSKLLSPSGSKNRKAA